MGAYQEGSETVLARFGYTDQDQKTGGLGPVSEGRARAASTKAQPRNAEYMNIYSYIMNFTARPTVPPP